MHPRNVGSTYLMMMQPTFVSNALPMQRVQAAATQRLRQHRVETGYSTVDPSLKAVVTESHRASPGQVKLVAERIRGIEQHYKDLGKANDDGERLIMGALVLTGANEIREWYGEFAKSLDAIEGEIAKLGRADLWQFVDGVGLLAASLLAYSDLSPVFGSIGMLGTCMFEPWHVATERLTKDLFHRQSLGRAERFLENAQQERHLWAFDSNNYSVTNGFLSLINSRHTSSEEAMEYVVGYSDTFDFGPVKDFIIKPAMSAMSGVGNFRENINNAIDAFKPAWVGIDRLLHWNHEAQEPEMILFLRAAAKRPKFPKTVREKAGVLLPQGLQLVPTKR